MTDFLEMPAFHRRRREYLDDTAYDELRKVLQAYPHAGDPIQGTGGVRKLRRPGPRDSRGQRDGVRVICYGWDGGSRFWLFTVNDRDETDKLTVQQRWALGARLREEIGR